MRAVSLLAGVAVALVAGHAAAEDLNLSWQAPAGCPSGKQVHDAAIRTAGDAGREPLDADVRVDHAARWSVTIRTKRAGVASAERQLQAASCAALADATAVILALALIPPAADADAPTVEAPEPAPPPAPEAPAGLAAAAAPARAPADADRAAGDRYAHTLTASASFATDSTSLPAPAVGGRAGLAWTPGRARVELAGAYFLGQSKTTDTSQAGASFALLVAGARGCWALARGAIELSPCAGADVQRVSAKGFGAATNYDASAAWVSATGGALVRFPVTSWLALRGEADALVPLTRPRFVVEGDGAVHKPAAIGLRAGIGAEILFL